MSSADKPALPELASLPGEERPAAGLKGAAAIREAWKRLPARPGVYRMLGADGAVLYVGKAKSLKARVAQYAQGRGHSNHITRMIAQTVALEVIVTATETEALLLETNMIKRLQPRFNVLMRDDKSFPYIAIRTEHEAPQLIKHRGAKSFKGKYYGPFASAGAVNRTLNTLQKAFLLRSCSDSVYAARTRPCMLFQIKRCAAPCVGLVDTAQYGALVSDAEDFLEGRSADLQDRLAAEMRAASDALDFENAARLRNRIRALASVRAAQGINPSTFAEADVFALAQDGGESCIQVFFFRAGQNWGNRAYFPRHAADETASEILSSFLAQFYDDKTPPALVLVSETFEDCALLEEALSLRAERRVEIRAPQRGEKRDVLDAALLNAREALSRRMAESANVAKLLEGVADAFALPRAPERIEVYDNSHIQGSAALGAMIVAGPDGFVKNQYRKFNMKTEEFGGDDYAMMKAMIRRRFARMIAESAPASPVDEVSDPSPRDGGVDFSKERDDDPVADSKFGACPDLVLIDGGEGQLAAARDALRELGLTDRIALVAIAKGPDRDAGRERFFMPGRAPFRLDEKSPVLYYLQRLRDESHRFAIGAHRGKRRAAIAANPLDEIAGVGPSRKRALLDRFGSARGVSRAALAELELVDGVSKELAKRIYDFFHDKG
jgi:excinuclease ABC subunit C